jgi:glycyl-tRNA synthetase
MREFTQAEAQLFIKKELKNNFPKYKEVAEDILPFWDYKSQEKAEPAQKITLKEALEKGLIKSQAYIWGLNIAYKLFKNLGIPEENIRLRQHFPDEKAFYADDAWDVEINTKSFGWIEACGVHDRTDYDLKQHAKHSGTPLEAHDEETKEKYVPHIIEIAFGSDRPVFTVLDNFYEEKEKDEGKTTLKLPYHISPITASILPLMKKPELTKVAKRVFSDLGKEFTTTYDETGAIGRRYLRAAEAGTPFCITIDYESLEGEETVTLRDRDTEKQKRVKTKELKNLIRELISGEKTFEEI